MILQRHECYAFGFQRLSSSKSRGFLNKNFINILGVTHIFRQQFRGECGSTKIENVDGSMYGIVKNQKCSGFSVIGKREGELKKKYLLTVVGREGG